MYDLCGCKYKDFLLKKNLLPKKNGVFSKKTKKYML